MIGVDYVLDPDYAAAFPDNSDIDYGFMLSFDNPNPNVNANTWTTVSTATPFLSFSDPSVYCMFSKTLTSEQFGTLAVGSVRIVYLTTDKKSGHIDLSNDTNQGPILIGSNLWCQLWIANTSSTNSVPIKFDITLRCRWATITPQYLQYQLLNLLNL